MMGGLLYPEVGRQILTAFYQVYNTLGFGFLEKVYENALVQKLRNNGHHIRQQVPIKVYFEGQVIGDYFADIIVDNIVIIEVKAAEALHEAHEAQLTNYLRATNIELGFLVNFGEKPEFRRRIFTNDRKEAINGKGL
jgi:GxxExxY protein